MPRKPKSNLSETMRLRYYVMNVIYRNPNRSVRLPSSRELATTFGVARSTVQLALEGLIAEGYLASKPGVATFTVPGSISFSLRTEKTPLIGLALGTGDYFFYDQSAWLMLSHMGVSASDRGCNIRMLDNATLTPENITEIIDNNYLDALLCSNIKSTEVIRKAAEKIPVVTLGTPRLPGISSVEFDWRPAAEQFRKLLLRENRSRVLLSMADTPLTALLHELDDGQLHLEQMECATPEGLARLRTRLEADPPDALVCGNFLPEIQSFFEELRIDPVGKCQLFVCITHPRSNFRGGCFALPYDRACDLAADMLHRRLLDGDESVRHEICDIELILKP